MNIPPILERLLLSNEAVFKNATLGLTGENMVYVPPGKTAVLLEFSVEPFVNAISSGVLEMFQLGAGPDGYIEQFQDLKKRLCYQLQIINDNYATYFSFHDAFKITKNTISPATNESVVELVFNGKREELFIYTDRSMYFNFLYPYKVPEIGTDNTGITPNYDTPDNKFLPKIQQLPKKPVTFYENNFIDFLAYATINSPALDAYFPVNWQTQTTSYPQMEYLRFFANIKESSIMQPEATGNTLLFEDLFTLPLLLSLIHI
jgi:hypothetical protein